MSRRAWVLFALLSIVWGIPYLLIKVAVAEIPVPVLVFGRVAIASLLLWPIALRENAWRSLRNHWKPLVAFSVLEFAIPWGLLSHAEKTVSSSMAGLLMASIPIATICIGRLTGDREHLGLMRSGGLALGLLGVFVLAAPTLQGDGLAITQILIAAVCYSTAAVVTGKYLNSVPAFSMTAACLTLASLIYLVPALLAWPTEIPSIAAFGSVVGLAIFCSALAFVGFFYLVREAGVSRAVLVTYLNPAVAGIAGVLILKEPVTLHGMSAFALILGGSLMAAAGSVGAQIRTENVAGHGPDRSKPSTKRPRCPACVASQQRLAAYYDSALISSRNGPQQPEEFKA